MLIANIIHIVLPQYFLKYQIEKNVQICIFYSYNSTLRCCMYVVNMKKLNIYFSSYLIRKVTGTDKSWMLTSWYGMSGCVLWLGDHVVASRHRMLGWLCSNFLDIAFPFSEYLGEISHLALHLQPPEFTESGPNVNARRAI